MLRAQTVTSRYARSLKYQCSGLTTTMARNMKSWRRSGASTCDLRPSEVKMELENVAIANALQLEAARRGAVPTGCNCCNSSSVPSLKSLSLSVAILERFSCWYVTLRCDLALRPRDLNLWPLTLNIRGRPASPRSNSVRNLSEIGQSAAELLQFEMWPYDLEVLNICHVLRYALR